MAYYYRVDQTSSPYKVYYNNEDPGDGNEWKLNNDNYISVSNFASKFPASIEFIKFKDDLEIPLTSFYSSSGPLTVTIYGDLSGFKFNNKIGYGYIASGYVNINFAEGIILPKGYENLNNFGHSETSYSIGFLGKGINVDLISTKTIDRVYGKVNINGGKFLNSINGPTINSDTSKFINLKTLSNVKFIDPNVTINNKLLKTFNCSDTSLESVIIKDAANGLDLNLNNCSNLSTLEVDKSIALNSIRVSNTIVKNVDVVVNSANALNYAFQNCKLLKEVTITPLVNLSNLDYTFDGCSVLTTINMNCPVAPNKGSNTFRGCGKIVGGNGTTYNSSHIDYLYAKNDNSTPGYFSYTNDLLYTHNVYSTTDYYTIVYDRYATDKLDITFYPKYLQTIDYWLQYKPDTDEWVNIGSKLNISGNVNSNQRIIAIPKIATASDATYSVNLSSVPSNSCTLTGAGVYVAGDNVIITASPNEGYIFKQWEELINDTWVVLSDTKIFAINAIGRDRTIRAVCIKDTPDVAVSLTLLDDGNGTTFGSGRYLKGGKAEAAASAYAGYKFVKWTDELGNTVSASKVYTFIINKDTTLTANFAKDPYYNGGTSGTGGGGGNYDNESDIVGVGDDAHSNFFSDTGGFLSVYIMDEKLEDFKNVMFGTSLEGIIENVFTKIGSLGGNFTDYILNFYKIPLKINSVGEKPFRMGWYATDSRYPYTTATGRRKSFGKIHITPYWGNALDYKSNIQIYLPYIGYEYLDTAEIMDKDIEVIYNISYLDGSCVAQIYVDNNLKYQFNGDCSSPVPISQVNMAEVTQKALSLGASVITAGAAAGAASSALTAGNNLANFDMPETLSRSASELSKGNALANRVGDNLQNATLNVGGDVRRCSNLSGNLGVLSSQTPYIIISRPRLCMPDNYAHYHGYPSNITSKIGDLSGYTVVSNIHLEGLDATSSEIEELERILKSGFVIK